MEPSWLLTGLITTGTHQSFMGRVAGNVLTIDRNASIERVRIADTIVASIERNRLSCRSPLESHRRERYGNCEMYYSHAIIVDNRSSLAWTSLGCRRSFEIHMYIFIHNTITRWWKTCTEDVKSCLLVSWHCRQFPRIVRFQSFHIPKWPFPVFETVSCDSFHGRPCAASVS